METPKTTAKDFFLWFGAMVALYWSVFAFISLIFSYLDYAMPDALSYYANPYLGSVSYEMASLIVVFPVFLLLMRVIRGDIARDTTRGQIWVRKWAIVLTLFIAGVTLVGDLITLLMYFFNGDVTLRFVLKVLVVLLVAGGGFLHFMADLKGYYERNPQKALVMTWATGILVALTLIAGFFIVGTPWNARLYRYDDQKVQDLQNIQWQVVNYWQQKQSLPPTLEALSDPLSGFVAPQDPQSGEPYEYKVKGSTTFELCATFNAEVRPGNTASEYSRYSPEPIGKAGNTWDHSVGRTCFERTIDPDLYPPARKQM